MDYARQKTSKKNDSTLTLLVTFYKEISHGMGDMTLEKVEFEHKKDMNKSDYENMTDAYDIAVSRGHNPSKNISIKEV